jgi:hypothetical protein
VHRKQERDAGEATIALVWLLVPGATALADGWVTSRTTSTSWAVDIVDAQALRTLIALLLPVSPGLGDR